MTLINRRHQRAVGQGFFHTAELASDDGFHFRYVYDCGAMEKYATERNAQVDAYIKEAGQSPHLDVLFISHIHFDHISGIKRLLDKSKGGFQVDTIVLPLINVEVRLLAFARAATDDPVAVGDKFFRDFVISPSDALAQFEPRQIVFVERNPRGQGAPGSGEDTPDGPPDIPDIRGSGHDGRIAWKLIGRGKGRISQPPANKADGSASDTLTFVIEDTLAIALDTREQCTEWILAPFVDPTIQSKEQLFIRELANARGLSIPKLKRWLQIATNIEKLLSFGLADLQTAYGAVEKDFNITSLCLYSGPIELKIDMQCHYMAVLGQYGIQRSNPQAVGWIATGDAALKAVSRAKSFEDHYGALLRIAATVALPHHGSDQNHNCDLLKKIDAEVHIAAADQFSKWKHPGAQAVQCIASMGRFVSVVTGSTRSEVVETVTVRCATKSEAP